jgi:S-adenosylmethionine decarboxylase
MSFPLIEKGTHIILDIFDIENNEILKYENTIIEILDKIVNKFNLNVVNKALYQFKPYGFTGVYVLSESHLSIHTFVDERKVAMDLYTCKIFKNTDLFIDFIKYLFNNSCKIKVNIIDR